MVRFAPGEPLGPAADARLGGPYWLQSAHWRERLSLNAYTERMAAAHRRSAGADAGAGGGATDFVPRSMRPSALAASLAHRCQWILGNTMGSPRAFAHRRTAKPRLPKLPPRHRPPHPRLASARYSRRWSTQTRVSQTSD